MSRTTERKRRGRPPLTDRGAFLDTWNGSATREEAAAKLGMLPVKAGNYAQSLRRQGFDVRRLANTPVGRHENRRAVGELLTQGRSARETARLLGLHIARVHELAAEVTD